LQEEIKKNSNKIVVKIIILILTYTLVKYYKFRAYKYYFSNLVNLFFIINNKYNYIKLYINIIYKFVKIIIIIIIINKDTNAKRENKENKNKILLID